MTPLILPLLDKAVDFVDDLFESDDEKRQAKLDMAQLSKSLQQGQIEINKIEAGHRSLWVAGWRPGIGWICVAGCANNFIAYPFATAFGAAWPLIPEGQIYPLIMALLGLGTMRSFEKHQGLTK